MTYRSKTTRKRGPKAKYLWTTVLVNNVACDETAQSSVILAPSDWERSTASFERATLVGIRGWYVFSQSLQTPTAIFAYIGLYDEDEVSSLADVAATYDSEDILFTFGASLGGLAGSLSSAGNLAQMDVKTNRKITSASEVRIVRTLGAGNASFTFTCLLRVCVRYA